MKIGITYSHRHVEYLGLDSTVGFASALDTGFSHIRLCTYWSECEPSAGKFDFSVLEQLLSQCEAVHQSVILTVGVKAPRWPEFYWPEWVEKKGFESLKTQKLVLRFVKETVKRLRSYTCISHWQLENEPLDPSGPDGKKILKTVLQQEKVAITELDARPIILTLWGNDMRSRGILPAALEIADEVGVDLYPRQFMTKIFSKSFYGGPRVSDSWLKEQIAQSPKPVWIAELQAEPWEANDELYRAVDLSPQASISPDRLEENIQWAESLGVSETLLWGFEYWLYQQKQGNNDYFQIVNRFL